MPGTFVYTPVAGTVLNAGAAQTLSVTFTPTDAANYTHARRRRRHDQRAEGDAARSRWATPADITYGTALSATQLNATANVPGTFVYTPLAGTVLNAGAGQTLSVTFTPTDAANYTTATKTVDDQRPEGDADDHLVDAGGHHLRHGAERDAAERDRERRRGRSSTSPVAGTVLNAGAGQTLSVTFTPTDAANYTDGDGDGDDQRAEGDAGRSRGRRRRTSPTARR